jgi:hypothetical protein
MIILDDSRAGEFPLPWLRGIKGKDAIKAFVEAGGVKIMEYTVLVYKAEEGVYWAEVPSLPGCYSQGETVEETMKNGNCSIISVFDKVRHTINRSGLEPTKKIMIQ